MLALMLFFVPHLLSATTFTAVASGNWSSALTWGGNAPGTNITAADQIVIEFGVTVTMDVDVALNHQLALLTLFGTLQSTNQQLTVTAGTIAGTGDLIVKKIVVGANGAIVATGDVVVGLLETSSTSLLLGADLQLQNELKITAGNFSLANSGSLLLDAGATIQLAGGAFLADTSLIQTASSINLVYSGSTQTTGSETDIDAIANLTVKLTNQGDSLKLGGNLLVSDTLNLHTGQLVLANHNLTLKGIVLNSAQASIMGSVGAGLTLDGTGNVSLIFSPNGALLDTFIVSQMNGNVTLNSDLTVSSSVNLQQGFLVLNGNHLTVNGALVTGVGASITGSATSDLTLDGSGNVSLIFSANGAVLDTFTVSQTNGNVTLNSDLTVGGSANLQQGSLVLNGNGLTINGAISTVAGASITGSATSDLALDGSGNVSLIFSANGAVLDTFTVSQTNGNVTLNSDLTVGGSIDLQQGSLMLNGNDLTVNGALSTLAMASITGSPSSGLILGGNTNVSVSFAPNGSMLDTLIVNQSNSNVTLLSNLTVGGSVDLQQGSLVLNGHNLTVNGSLSTAAGASITGSATSGLMLDGTGNVSLIFAGNGAVLDTFTVSQTNGNVTLNSNLTVGGSVDLQQGSLVLNGNGLTVNGTLTTVVGASITGSAASDLTLDGTGNVSLVFAGNGVVLDTFIVSQTNGNVMLNSNLSVGGSIDLQQGSLVLNNGNLTVNGSLATAPGASLTGSVSAGLILNGMGNLSPVFSANGAVLDTLVVNQNNGNVTLGSDLLVGNTVQVSQGALILNGNSLTVNGGLTTAAGASITGNAASSLILDGTGNISLVFSPNGAILDTFVVSQSGGEVTLNSDLSVATLVDLQQGALVLNGNNLTVNGSVQTAAGAALTGSLSSGLTLNGSGNATLIFSPNGASLDTLVVNQSNGNVLLTSDLTVGGNIDLQQGSLVLNGGNLSVNGGLNTAVGASITGSATSGLILNGTGNLTPVFSLNGAILDTFVVNQSNGNVILGSDLTVEVMLGLQQGSLLLNGQHLTLNGSLNTSAGASITGSSSSGLTVAGSGLVSLVFAQNGSLLDTFVVQQSGGGVTLNSDLAVGGSLELEDGHLVLNGNDLTINGSISTTSDGAITGSSSSNLILDGNGNASVAFSSNGAILNSIVVSQTNGNVMLNSGLTVEGNIELQQGSLVLSNGNLTVNGTLNTAAGASITGSASAGLVLNGSGNLTPVFSANGGILDTLVVNQSNGNVVLGSKLTVGSSVDLLQGSLVLNGNQLTINGALNTSAGASITGSSSSGLIFDGTSDVSIVFAPNTAALGTFTVSQSNGSVTLNNDLTVNNSLALHQGSLVLNGHNLVSNGSFTGVAGATITGSATSGLMLDGTGNAAISFAANGALLDTLVVSQSNGNANLSSDLTVGGHLDLQQGALSLNGKDLTINGTFSNAVGASIMGNGNSALVLDGMGHVNLVFTQNSAMLDTLIVSQANGNVSLSSNLTLGGLLDLQQGELMLNNNDLTLQGSLSTGAGASIAGSANAGLILDGTGNVSLVFSPNASILENLTVSQSNGNVTLTSDLSIVNQINLQQGSLMLGGYDLTVKGTLNTAAGANIAGNGNSGLFLDGTGSVNLVFAPNTAALDSLVVSQSSGNVTLTSDLTVESFLFIQQGSLVLDGNDLTIHGMLTAAGGATITGGPTSGLILDGQGNVSLVFSPAGPVLDTLVVSQSNGFVSMTGDLTVGNLVNLQQGTLVLNGNDLTVNGTLTTAAGASITGSPFSGLILNGSGDISLVFAPNAALLSAIAVSQANGNVSLNANLTVSNYVNIQQGSLLLNGNNLTVNGSLAIAAGASITGSATSGLILDGSGNVPLSFAANGAVLDTMVISQTNGNVTLNSDLAIEGKLDLQQGKLVLGDFDLTLGNNGQVAGGSSNSYVVTNGIGVFSAFVEAGGGGVAFPCGSTSAYLPAVIAQGSGASDTHIEMNVGTGVLAYGTSGTDLTATESLVNHTWFVGAATANAQLDLELKFLWNAAAEVNGFDHGACFISHYVNGGWDSHAVAQASAEANGYFSISRNNINALSPFRVADATSSRTTELLLRDFQVFPNPVADATPLTLRLDSPLREKVQIRVLNTAGTVLMTEYVTLAAGSNDYVLPTVGLGAGVYMVDIRGAGQRVGAVRRFVKL
jgi:fibronectin-binding autotransporter adhesin